jgi:predicted RNA binding protein YcfA (HicA-like mRNA interferase family)
MSAEMATIDFLSRTGQLRLDMGDEHNIDENFEVFNLDWRELLSADPDFGESDYSGFSHEILGELMNERPSDFNAPLPDWVRVDHARVHPGFDTCAWYQPIHTHGSDWGIFVYEECVSDAAFQIAWQLKLRSSLAQNLRTQILSASLLTYLFHEQFHHRIECLGIRLHVASNTPSYLTYSKNVYKKTFGTDSCIEEALANSFSYRRFSESPYSKMLDKPVREATRRYLDSSFKVSPPGYRQANKYLKSAQFQRGLDTLFSQVRSGNPKTALSSDWEAAPGLSRSYLPLTSNIWTVVRKGTKSVFPVSSRPLTCTSKNAERIVLDEGGRLRKGKGKGSHREYLMPDGSVVRIPFHSGDLRRGTLNNILKPLGYSIRDLPILVKK